MMIGPISPWKPIALAERLREAMARRDDRIALRHAMSAG
jgi:hypothetical protein